MKRDIRLDVIRTTAIFMIFTFHFCCTIGNTGMFYGYANGGWGSVGTTIFFLLSGFLLGKRYHEKLSLKKFYWKRWLSIYPLFYLTFAAAYVTNGVTTGNWRYGGSLWRLVYTVLGCDYYVNFYGIPSYALVGEWFTAVIVMIYILYPLLKVLFQRFRLWGSVLIYGLYFFNLYVDWFRIVDDVNPVTGIAMFWTGMLLAEFADHLTRKWYLIPELVVAALIVFVKLPGNPLLWKNMLGCMIFGILFFCAGYLEKLPKLAKIFSMISLYSYSVYLCHHFIMLRGVPVWGQILNGRFHTAELYMVSLVITGILAVTLYQIMGLLKKMCSVTVQHSG